MTAVSKNKSVVTNRSSTGSPWVTNILCRRSATVLLLLATTGFNLDFKTLTSGKIL